jgi:hypothetical protein
LTLKKVLLIVVLLPIVGVAGYVLFLWASTIHDSIEAGTKYGFTIGQTKEDAHTSLLEWQEKHPELIVMTYTEIEGFTQKQFTKLSLEFDELKNYNQWRVHLNGEQIGKNSIRLTFENDTLTNIYRHRQYYELL